MNRLGMLRLGDKCRVFEPVKQHLEAALVGDVLENAGALRAPAQKMPYEATSLFARKLGAKETFEGHPREVLIHHFIPPIIPPKRPDQNQAFINYRCRWAEFWDKKEVRTSFPRSRGGGESPLEMLAGPAPSGVDGALGPLGM
jgi:hypothetical protein